MKYILIWILVLSCNLAFCQSPIYASESLHHPIVAKNGMVSTQHKIATQVGIDILNSGGNAVDAAVGVGFALAVVLPRAGNLGGGGFMLVHLQENEITRAINYREMAPSGATRDMYLDAEGNVDDVLFNQSYKSIGVPGTVAGLTYALDNYGTMKLKDVIKPAIRLAEKGFPVTYDLSRLLIKNEDRLKNCDESKSIFFKGNEYYQQNDILKQPDLAWSLKQICKKGKAAFYEGKIADRIVASMEKHGGLINHQDLKNYQVTEMDPVVGTYKGYEIASMPPPSSGGVHIIQMLNILELLGIDTLQHNSAKALHLLAETMRLAFADRSKHLGDPEFWDVPVKGLISKKYAAYLRTLIKADTVNNSKDILPGNPNDYESEETTHFSVADRWGNVVSNTYTLNFSHGSGYTVEGTGILLNNEMGDFSAKPGFADAYGLIGDEANAIQPRKRPLSSMTPTIVFKDGKPFLVTGSPGGSRIISTVLQTILNVIDFELNVAEAANAPKIHHQWYPDILYYEKGLSSDTRALLTEKGHDVQLRDAMGSTQSIMIKDGRFLGASDPRRPDAKTMGI